MSCSQEVSAEMYLKICKKIAQLTKVIYTLNSKAEEHENIVQSLKDEHDKNIEKVMVDSKNKILKFKVQAQGFDEKNKEIITLHEIIDKIKTDNKKLNDSLLNYVENTKLNEKQLQSDYENKYLVLQNKLLERKRQYDDLLHSFKNFQKEIDHRKQEEIQLTKNHEEEIKKLSQSYQNDLHLVNSEKIAHQNQILEKSSQYDNLNMKWEQERQELEKEYEAKISKLKSFYNGEIELVQLKMKESSKEKWTQEKNKIVANFELQKSEMSSTISFLKKQCQVNEHQLKMNETELENVQKQLTKFMSDCDDLKTKLQCSTIKESEFTLESIEKSKKINDLENKCCEMQSMIDLMQKDTILIIERKDNDYNTLQKSLETAKKDLHESKSNAKLHQANVAKRNIEYENLLKKWNAAINREDENKDMNNKLTESLKEKNMEIEKLKCQLKEAQEKQSLNENSKEKCFNDQLKSEKEKYMENINKFKLESEQILKDSQQKLLEEIKKQKNAYMAEQKNLLDTKNETIISLESCISDMKNKIIIYEDELKVSKLSLEQTKESSDMLRKQLNGKECNLKTMQSKVDGLEKEMAEIKINLSKEREKSLEEKENLKKRLENSFKNDKNSLECKWEEELSNLKEKLLSEKEFAVREIKASYETNRSHEINLKDKETENLKIELIALKAENLRLSKDRTNFSEELKNTFEKEKQKMLLAFSKELEDLKSNLQKGKQHEVESLLAKQQNTVKSLRVAHERTLVELRSEHALLLNSVKSQLTLEKEEVRKELQEDHQSEKARLQEFINLQSQERITHLSKEFESQIKDLKIEIETTKELRQKEFHIHTKKITDLLQDLEKEKCLNVHLNKTVSELEVETKTLRQELEQKVQDILEIRRECNSRMRFHTEEIVFEHRKEMDLCRSDSMKRQQQILHESREHYAQFEETINALKLKIAESEEKYKNRPSRDEDLIIIKELQQRIFEQEITCQKLSEERKLYRLELVNREENFNRVFKSTPNVGFVNPVELSNKRKSARKK